MQVVVALSTESTTISEDNQSAIYIYDQEYKIPWQSKTSRNQVPLYSRASEW